MRVGFVGLGTMGEPMAARLLDAGVPLTVWNRTPARCAPLLQRGAVEAASIDALFERCDTVLLMLLDEAALDAVLARGSPMFARRVQGRTLAVLGTHAPPYSQALEADVQRCGGRYVEAPVSGSRGPAAAGALVGMLAGDAGACGDIAPLLAPLCRDVVTCGAVPAALRLKLAVNHVLIVLVAALAEAVRAAAASGVDLQRLRHVLDAGPMSSDVSRAKLDSLVRADFHPQAAIGDVARIAALVRDQAHAAGVDAWLIDAAARLYANADARGLSGLDMAAVLQVDLPDPMPELP